MTVHADSPCPLVVLAHQRARRLGIGHDAGLRRAGATTTRLGHPLTTAGVRTSLAGWPERPGELGAL